MCHCNHIVTLTRRSVVLNQSFGTCHKCHCKRGVTVNSVTVSGEICILVLGSGAEDDLHPSHARLPKKWGRQWHARRARRGAAGEEEGMKRRLFTKGRSENSAGVECNRSEYRL